MSSKRPRKFLNAEWLYLAMLSYRIDPEFLLPWVPKGLELDLWQGNAYISLVALLNQNVRISGIKLPLYNKFEQLNLRFYVHRNTPSGRRHGVMFIKQVLPYEPVAAAGRYIYRELCVSVPMKHDFQLSMKRQQENETFRYSWSFQDSWNHLRVETSGASALPKQGSLEAFVMERYWGFSGLASTEVLQYQVEHPPWKIRKVSVTTDWDLKFFYGKTVGTLLDTPPENAFLAEGSPIVLFLPERLTSA